MGNAFVQLHLAIFLAGFTGILGKLIGLSEGPLVWYRMLITSLLLYGFLRVTRAVPRIAVADALKICGVGVLVALHWIFFYGSIKYANVSIAVICFALTGFFTAILEPLLLKKKFAVHEFLFSMMVVFGIGLIFQMDTRFRMGIILGVLSAVFAALFTISIKMVGKKHSPTTMLLYQMAGGWVFLTLAAPIYLALFPGIRLIPTLPDMVYLFVLASLCTIGMFWLQINALRSLSAFTVNLSYNLEPVYSIVLAMVFFGEANDMNSAFYIGLTLICLSVLFQSMYAVKRHGGL